MNAWEAAAELARYEQWYVVTNDEIGGLSIANADKPVMSLALARGEIEVASLVYPEIAAHVVHLHNKALGFE